MGVHCCMRWVGRGGGNVAGGWAGGHDQCTSFQFHGAAGEKVICVNCFLEALSHPVNLHPAQPDTPTPLFNNLHNLTRTLPSPFPQVDVCNIINNIQVIATGWREWGAGHSWCAGR